MWRTADTDSHTVDGTCVEGADSDPDSGLARESLPDGTQLALQERYARKPRQKGRERVILAYWLLAGIVLWCYLGYPLVMVVRSRRLRPVTAPRSDPELPHVSVVLAVRNEAARIPARLDNLVAQEYPADRLEVVLVANGCVDGTVAVARAVAARASRVVQVLTSEAGQGKAGAINLGVSQARGSVVVFADARQRFAPDAVRQLVAPFSDPEVGVVTGRLVVGSSDRSAVDGMRQYWSLETRLRRAESGTGSVVGATGAIYAMRRALFVPLPANLILDDLFLPLQAARAGSRIVMADDALAYDRPLSRSRGEFGRRRRTMVGNLQLVRVEPTLLLPWRNPLFMRYVSHKLLRVVSPLVFLGMLVLSALLPGPLYGWLFVAHLGIYGAGLLGLVMPARILSIPAAFVLLHAAVLAALVHFRSDARSVWQPALAEVASDPGVAVKDWRGQEAG